MRRILVATAFFILTATPTGAGVHRWTPVGPEGGTVTQLLPDPTTPDVVWALVDHRPFRSADGGLTWSERSTGLPFPLLQPPVESLAIDRAQPDTLLAKAGGLYRTTDAGVSWSLVLEASTLGSSFHLQGDPTAPGTFYVVNGLGPLRVRRSTDHGATWAPVGNDLVSPLITVVGGFAVDPLTPGRWYAQTAAGTNHLFVSTDFGASWIERGTGLPATDHLTDLFVAPTNPTTIWIASAGSGLHRSTDAGATFARSGPVRKDAYVVAVDPSDAQTVLALDGSARPNQYWRSSDVGTSWARRDVHVTRLPKPAITALAIDPFAATRLWAGTSRDGILASTDGAASWTPANAGLPRERTVCTLAAEPDGGTLHAIADGNLWTTRDGGTSWLPNTPDLAPPDALAKVTGVALDPNDADVVYAASPGGVFKSVDAGATWGPSGTGLPSSGARGVAVDPSASQTVYATTAAGVYRSLDGGTSFALRGPGAFTTVAVDPTLTSTLYFDGGVAVSTDGGLSTTTPELIEPFVDPPGAVLVDLIASVAPSPTAPGLVYAGVDATLGNMPQIWNEGSLGLSTNRLGTYDELSPVRTTALRVDPADELHLYVGVPEGARRSRDGGTTLESFRAGLGGTPCAFAGGAPGQPLYAGTLRTDPGIVAHGVFAIDEPPCATDAACDDGSDCTTDRCTGGRCAHDAVPDGTACDAPEEACRRGPASCVAGACHAPSGCDDGDTCTSDVCELPGICASTYDPTLCDDRRLGSAWLRIVARDGGSKVTFSSSDPSIPSPLAGGADDPSLAGATVELFPAGEARHTWTLPAGVGRPGWKVAPRPGLAYLFANPAAPAAPSTVRRLALRAKPQLRLTAFPAGAPIATGDLAQVGVRVTMGERRLCALFAGNAIKTNEPGRFVARGNLLPAGDCVATSLGDGS